MFRFFRAHLFPRLAILVAVVTSSVFVGAASAGPVPNYELDHFWCYAASEAAPPTAFSTIVVKDRFGEHQGNVGAVTQFCNPTRKTHSGEAVGVAEGVSVPINHPDDHLTLYSVGIERQPSRSVVVSNQFGRQQALTLGQAAALAVPTQKVVPNDHEAPVELDAFLCYTASGRDVGQGVGIQDELHRTGVGATVVRPAMLCNQVEKRTEGTATTVDRPALLLVCYDIRVGGPVNFTVQINNRFEPSTETLALGGSTWLCAPSQVRYSEAGRSAGS